MTASLARLTRPQQRALDSVRRLAAAPLDLAMVGEQMTARLTSVLPSDFRGFSTSDPELGLLVQGRFEGLPAAALQRFLSEVYPAEAAIRMLDLARAGRLASGVETHGPLYRDYLADCGLGPELLLVFSERGMLRGVACLARERGTRPFTPEELAFAGLAAPHVAASLRRAVLLESARSAAPDDASTLPGVAVFGRTGELVLRDERAARYLDDLAAIHVGGRGRQLLPPVVAGALAQLRWRLRRPDAATPAAEGVPARGHSGRWYQVHASAAEATDPAQAGHAVVVLAPVGSGQQASVLARVYGLTPREREVIVRVARGESGKRIAAALGLSPHTVQSHIDNACEKVGVRGRRELVARLFVDVSAARGGGSQ